MTRKDIENQVKTIISERLGVKDVYPNSLLEEDLGADSLDLVELIMAFEDEFDIEISDEEAKRIKTVGDAIKFVDERV